MPKALITGGAGFVGRHLTIRLLSLGWEVDVVDPIYPGTGAIHPDRGWPFEDPRRYSTFSFYGQDCREFFKSSEKKYDYAFHLAAIVGGRLVIENQPLAVADDLSIDAHFWQWAKERRPGKSVVFSSSAAYPIRFQTRENYTLLSEDMIDFTRDIGVPDLTYGWAKLTCEFLARVAYQRHGLRSVIYRPFSGYGEDQDLSYPFPSICKRILDAPNGSEIDVWGSGLQMRDFIHIEDCVDIVLATMDKIDDASPLNLSTGIFTSFIDLMQAASGLCGKSLRFKTQPDKPEGVFARGGDTARQLAFGCRPKIALQDGIRKAFDFRKELDSRQKAAV